MAWEYVNFDYPVPNLFEKHLVWLSADCNMYFAMKLNKSDSWNYYAGNGSHALLSGKILTSYGKGTKIFWYKQEKPTISSRFPIKFLRISDLFSW